MYAKARPESTKSLNRIDCIEMAAYLEYLRIVSNIRYGWKKDNMTRLKA